MRLHRFSAVQEFHARAAEFLLEREAEHNLLLGILSGLLDSSRTDPAGLYLATVEDAGRVAAVALRTPPANLVLSRAPLEAVRLIAADAAGFYAELPRATANKEPTVPGVLGGPRESRAFAEEWGLLTGREFSLGVRQRIYQLEAVTPMSGLPGELPGGDSGGLRDAGEPDLDLLRDWLAAFGAEALGEPPDPERERRLARRFLDSSGSGLVLLEVEGRPVSMAGFGGRTPNGVRLSAVYTPPELRGRGYATACVAALSQRLLDEGHRYCFLFTDLANPTSNHIYTDVGYRPVRNQDAYEFSVAEDSRANVRGSL